MNKFLQLLFRKISVDQFIELRCIPLDRVEEAGSCVFTGNPSVGRVLFAKAY
mgnify:CR=1 FL=1